MKKHLLVVLMAAFSLQSLAQQTTQSWNFDGETRQYIQYVPAVYDGSEPVPLVIALHGLGDNMTNFSNVGFQFVADTANFIVVYPEALEYVAPVIGSMGNAWNSGAGSFGIYPSQSVDDVGFINAIMDSVSSEFNIDQSRIFITGFSMGSFMSNRLACQLTNRVAAIAGVAGTIGDGYTCAPSANIPVCHIHGTFDTNVGYGTDGGGTQDNTFGLSATEWINYWSAQNNCTNIVLEGQFPDVASDGYTVDYVEYGGCAENARVVHYKVHGADHIWLGPSNDVFYTTEIWKFFLGASPTNLSAAGITQNSIKPISIYPNPATTSLKIAPTTTPIKAITVFDATGKQVHNLHSAHKQVDIGFLKPGAYRLLIATETDLYSAPFIKQ